MTETAPTPARQRWSAGAARYGALGLVLLVLYYSLTSTLEVRELRHELARAQAETMEARDASSSERRDLLERLDILQVDLDAARAEVSVLREQLVSAGITPASNEVAPQSPKHGPDSEITDGIELDSRG